MPDAALTANKDGTREWLCEVCGFVYSEAEGWPEEGIPPGTRWEDLPHDWCCPQCRAEKSHFAIFED